MFVVVYVSPEQFKRMMDGKVFMGMNKRIMDRDTAVQVATTRIREVIEHGASIQYKIQGGY
ncbi:hypothetical protein D3C81_1040400 [compost metagenome]